MPNKLNGMLKEAVLQAAENAGGERGLIGYLERQAISNAAPFMSLLGKILPMQVTGEDGGPIQAVFKTVYANNRD